MPRRISKWMHVLTIGGLMATGGVGSLAVCIMDGNMRPNVGESLDV